MTRFDNECFYQRHDTKACSRKLLVRDKITTKEVIRYDELSPHILIISEKETSAKSTSFCLTWRGKTIHKWMGEKYF